MPGAVPEPVNQPRCQQKVRHHSGVLQVRETNRAGLQPPWFAGEGLWHREAVTYPGSHQAANWEPSLGSESEEKERVPAHPLVPEEKNLPTRAPSPWEAILEASPWG